MISNLTVRTLRYIEEQNEEYQTAIYNELEASLDNQEMSIEDLRNITENDIAILMEEIDEVFYYSNLQDQLEKIDYELKNSLLGDIEREDHINKLKELEEETEIIEYQYSSGIFSRMKRRFEGQY